MSIINSDESDPDAEQILNITPQDIMDFFKETEFFSITANVTHGNTCSGQNCRRTLVDKSWEYYCDGSHDNLSGRNEQPSPPAAIPERRAEYSLSSTIKVC